MAVLKELKNFIMRGNVMDMAIGVVVGGAFGKIVTSLVDDIIMPPIGYLLNGVDFSQLKFVMKQATVDATGATVPEVTLNYGSFIQTIINFLIIATAIFFTIKAMNSLYQKKEEAPAPATPPAPTKEEQLLAEIRDLLKDKK